ncbi:hypothetical protein DOTSEDRAFT_71748, partial [Dothistroma septosporum NZE10]
MVDYSMTATKLPDGITVIESIKIALALGRSQPVPPVHLDNNYSPRALDLITQSPMSIFFLNV